GQRAWKVDAFGDRGSRRLRQHGDVLQCEIAEELLGDAGVGDFLRERWSHALDFSARQDGGVRHVSFSLLNFFSVLPLYSVSLWLGVGAKIFTTETQRTQRTHREMLLFSSV